MEARKIIAIAFSDLHLTLQVPAVRADNDWLGVQAVYLDQVRQLQTKYDCPILFGGDLFDRWNAPAELINFALEHLPEGSYTVAGQHDLPNHRLDLMERSAYGTLVKCGAVQHVRKEGFRYIASDREVFVYGASWGEKLPVPHTDGFNIAMVHRYIWDRDAMYPGAPIEAHAHAGDLNKELEGYQVAIFGDNHIHFRVKLENGCTVFNCGGFIRRKSDEISRRPCVGLVYDNGKVERHYLYTTFDKFHDLTGKVEGGEVSMRQFIQQLEELGEQGVNFRETVLRLVQGDTNMNPGVRKVIEEILS